MKKWWFYQKERFPLVMYIPMMALFALSGLSYSWHLAHDAGSFSDIGLILYVIAVLVTLFWFMLLRIADEHKDFEEDIKYRPYLPVPRGLITLKELRNLGLGLGIIQVLMLIWLDWQLLIVLAIVYVWFLLMYKEFFIPQWLKARPICYLASHMLIMPLISLLITAIEWLPRGRGFSLGILIYLIASFCNGTIVEVGRKLRAQADEEAGVDTYTGVWGVKRAMVIWIICLTISGASTVWAGLQIRMGREILIVFSILYVYGIFTAKRFAKKPTPKNAKVFKILPSVWTLLIYLMLGLLPFF